MKQDKPDNRTEKRKIGDIGENIACRFLMKHGFEIVEQKKLSTSSQRLKKDVFQDSRDFDQRCAHMNLEKYQFWVIPRCRDGLGR